MKKALGILLVLALIATVFVACSQDAGQKVAEELVSVNFDGSKARSLTPSRDPFAPGNYVWTYTAQKADTTGLTTGETTEQKRINDGKGLSGKVPGFSQGYWNFTLYAYEAEEYPEGTGKYRPVPDSDPLYSGTASHVKVAKGDENVITVSVSPATTGNGYIAFDKAHLFLNAIKTGEDINAQGDERSANFEYGIYAINDTTFSTNLFHEVDGKTILTAGSYFVRVSYRVAGDGQDRFDIADEAIVAVVYGGQTTTITGSIGELSTDVSFGANEVEIPSAEGTPAVIPADLSNYADTDAGYAAYQAAPVTEEHKPIVDVELDNATPTTEASVVATVPARAVYSLLQESIPDDPNTTSKMSLNLTVDINTQETTASQMAYDVNLIKTVETTTTTATGTSTSTNASLVKNVAAYVSAEVKVGAGLNDVKVYHSGILMNAVTAEQYAGDVSQYDTNGAGVYYYAGDTLYLKTKSFSPFVVTFTPDTIPEESKVLNATKGVGYADLKAAIDDASEGDTIRLLSDLDFSQVPYSDYKWAGSTYHPLEITKNGITLDLNGKTIDNMGNCAIVFGHILAKDGKIRNVTIKNGTLKVGKTDNVYNSYALGIAGVDGALVENVTTVGGINVFTLSQDVVIKNCNVAGTKYYTVCAQTGSDVTIEGTTYVKNTDSTVASKTMFWIQGAGTDSDVVTPENPTGAFGPSSITIKSGSFTIDTEHGGNLYSEVKPVLMGGTYNIDPSACVADGYTAVAQGTNPETWVVKEADVQVLSGTEIVAYMTLGQFRDDVNNRTSYAGKTVTLLRNVDLENEEWEPIGTPDHPFNGVFDGQNHTIKNLKVTETGMFSGLFGVVCGSNPNAQFDEIGDVFNLNNNTLDADLNTKIAAGNYSAVIENLTIDGFTVDCWIADENNEENARYSGALVGSAQYAYIGNCDVTNGTVTGCKAFGGVIGRIDGSAVVDCNTASKVTVIAKANLDGQEAGGFNFGGIIGATSYKFDSNYGRNIVKDCTNLATLRKTDGQAIGSIAGIIGFGQNGGYQTPSIVVNCVHNGTIECSTGVGDVAGIAGGCVNVLYFVGCSNTDDFSSVTGTVAQNAGIATAPSSNNHNWRAIDCSTCELTAPTHTDKWNQILNCVNDVKTLVNCTYGTESGINYPEA